MNDNFDKLGGGLTALDEHYAAETRAVLAKLATFDESCQELGREMERLSNYHRTRQKTLKSRFNVFTALLKFHDEVKLHSRWLCYLLDPKAGHDCGTLFLDLFIQTLRERGVQRHDDEAAPDILEKLNIFATEKATVKKEVTIRYGINRRVDIHIECQWGAIIIENKTAPGEGDDQIHDYVSYCETHCRGRNYLLLYLTPVGEKAKSAGRYEEKYRRISYSGHILHWIEECLRSTSEYVHIHQALQQYKNVVNELLGRTTDYEYMEQIIEILKKHPAIIEHFGELSQAMGSIRTKCCDEFLSQLRSRLAADGVTLSPQQGDWLDVIKTSSPTINCDTGMTVRLRPKDKNLILTVMSSTDECKRKAILSNKEGLKCAQAALGNKFAEKYNWRTDEWWPLGEVTIPEVFSHEVLADWASLRGDTFTGQLDETVNIIREYLKVIDDVWPQVAKVMSVAAAT